MLLFFLWSGTLHSQIVYSHGFTKKLKRAGLEFIEPVEGFYKVRLLRKDEFLRYDMVVHSEEKQLEMRFVIDPRYALETPHITFFNLATSLATNEQRFNIKMNVLATEEAKSVYGADWAAYSDFIPKRSLSNMYYARLLTLFHQQKGIAHQILLFNRYDDELNMRLRTISFLPASNDAD